jgi:hypothetical protein
MAVEAGAEAGAAVMVEGVAVGAEEACRKGDVG